MGKVVVRTNGGSHDTQDETALAHTRTAGRQAGRQAAEEQVVFGDYQFIVRMGGIA